MGAVQKMGEDGKVPFKDSYDPCTVVKINHFMVFIEVLKMIEFFVFLALLALLLRIGNFWYVSF